MLIRNGLAAAALLASLYAGPALGRDYLSSDEFYWSSDGSRVHGPTRQANPAYGRVSADCRDGTHSYSHHRQGTCSGHGGVDAWR